MGIKQLIANSISIFIGVLAALLAYHYHLTITHCAWYALSHGIPWSSKYFWPLAAGKYNLLLVAEVLLGPLMWFGAHRYDVENRGFTFSLYIIPGMVGILAGVGGLIGGFVVFGIASLAFGVAVMWSLTTSYFWRERATTT